MDASDDDYEYVTYGVGTIYLEEGEYSLPKLKEIVSYLEELNKRNKDSMKELNAIIS